MRAVDVDRDAGVDLEDEDEAGCDDEALLNELESRRRLVGDGPGLLPAVVEVGVICSSNRCERDV